MRIVCLIIGVIMILVSIDKDFWDSKIESIPCMISGVFLVSMPIIFQFIERSK